MAWWRSAMAGRLSDMPMRLSVMAVRWLFLLLLGLARPVAPGFGAHRLLPVFFVRAAAGALVPRLIGRRAALYSFLSRAYGLRFGLRGGVRVRGPRSLARAR